jgi:hypothetical protein
VVVEAEEVSEDFAELAVDSVFAGDASFFVALSPESPFFCESPLVWEAAPPLA